MFGQKTKVGAISVASLVVICCMFLLAACGTTQFKLDLVASVGGSVTGAGEYDEGTSVTITATPNEHYTFAGWYLDAEYQNKLSSSPSYQATVDADKTYYALFSENEKSNITINKMGEGTVIGTGSYYVGEEITLVATPAAGYGFLGWFVSADFSGTPLSTDTSLSIVVTSDMEYFAVFGEVVSVAIGDTITNGTVTGLGQYAVGDTVTLTAVPNDYYVFSGWYTDNLYTVPLYPEADDPNKPAKENSVATITLTVQNGMTLYPLFTVSYTEILDEILLGAYNTYTIWGENSNYSVFATDADLNLGVSGDLVLDSSTQATTPFAIDFDINALLALDLEGYGSTIGLEVASTDATVFGIYYLDSSEGAKLYVDLGDIKYTYNMVSLADYLDSFAFKTPSDTPWSISSIINSLMGAGAGDEISEALGEILGSFITDFETSANSLSLDLDLNSIMTLVSGLLSTSNPEVADILGAIFNSSTPPVTLGLTANFENANGLRTLAGVELDLDIDTSIDLSGVLEGVSAELQNPHLDIDVISLEAGFSDTLPAGFEFDKSAFPETAINLLNISTGANLDFYSGEGNATLSHAYRFEINADLNPFAILPAISKNEAGDIAFDVNKIDWESLGFLSLRIYPRNIATEGEAQYLDTHDYLNIYYDSSESTQVYLYANFINPIEVVNQSNQQVVYSFKFNTAYEIREFIAWIQEFVGDIKGLVGGSTQSTLSANNMMLLADNTGVATTAESSTADVILNSLKALIGGENFNKVFVDTVLALTPNYTIAGKGLRYDETKGMTFDTTLLNLYTEIDVKLGKWELDLGKTLFGDATQVALKFDYIDYGKLNTRNADNEMLNPLTQNSYKDELAAASNTQYTSQADQMITKVISSEVLDNLSTTSAELEGFVNGKVGYTNSYVVTAQLVDGQEYEAQMGMLDAVIGEIDTTNNSVDVIFVLSYTHNEEGGVSSPFVNFNGFMQLVATMPFGIPALTIPYGLYTYTTTISLTA